MHETSIPITIPKFSFESEYKLNDLLKQLWMPTSFDPNPGKADFSGMDGSRSLYINTVRHKAFVEVNEQGTEAAAATTVEMSYTISVPSSFTADHPFIFLIQHRETGTILFMGLMGNPTAQVTG